MGQQVIVDSRGGASGRIGTEVAAKAAPDGYTMVLGNVAPLAILPGSGTKLAVRRAEGFPAGQPDRDLRLHPDRASLAARALGEGADRARRRSPGALTYASSGNMGGPHLAGELINLLANVKHPARAVQGQRSRGDRDPDRRIPVDVRQRPFGRPAHRRGQAPRARDHRPEAHPIPDLPTMAELLPGYEVTQWYGILVPAGTPKDIVNRLHTETVRAIASPKVSQVLTNLGTTPTTNSPEEFRNFIKSESDKWGDGRRSPRR